MPEQVDPITAGGLAYVDDRMAEARTHWEQAFRELRDAGELAAAARVATLLGELHWGGLGNASIGRGWLDRARRLLDECGPCVERGYWELARLACDRPDPAEVQASAERALDIATDFADVGLHTRALADLGYALVTRGRLASGFAHLDEALAAISSGEVTEPFAVSTTCCALLSACDRAGDVDRATEWLRVVRETVLAPAGGRPRMLGAHCELALGGVMCAAGEWIQAEQAVRSALDRMSGATAAQRAEATSRLAELQLQHGRIAEAAELLAPLEDHPAAAGALAQLHLSRGDPAVALAVLQRACGVMGADVLRRASLLWLTTEAALGCDQRAEAERAVAELRTLAEASDAQVVLGFADLADGLLAGRTDQALALFASARTAFTDTQRPMMTAHACLGLAEIASRGAAVEAARAAHSLAVRLDALALRDRAAAILRRHGVAAPRAAARSLPDLSAREAEILDGLRRGDSNAEIAARLYLSRKTVEHHVSRVLAKLGVRTRAEAAALAAARGSEQ